MKLLGDVSRVGVFVKTASHQIIEILGAAGLHFVVVDAEHAPFGPQTLDAMLLAGRAWQLPLLVRVPRGDDPLLPAVLDMGASGIIVPHVHSASHVREIVARAKLGGGRRGLSTSPRYAGYGSLTTAEAIRVGDDATVVCQIEDREGLDEVEAIAQVPGVDALFIGPLDLAHSLGTTDIRAVQVIEASERIIAAARAAGKAAAIFLADPADRALFESLGVSLFVIGSDQSLLRRAAAGLMADPSASLQPSSIRKPTCSPSS